MTELTQHKPKESTKSPTKKGLQRKASNEQDTKVQSPTYLQAKMAVSSPNDPLEQEADQVAEEVSRMPSGVAPQSAQRAALAPEETSQNPQSLQTKLYPKQDQESLQAKGSPTLSEEAEEKIQHLRGKGSPMNNSIRLEMEQKMSQDFSSVNIHNNGEAADLCKQINARAFTVGNDIFFSTGEYEPNSKEGKKLLAHELAHVVQQSSNSAQPKLHLKQNSEIQPKIYRADNKTDTADTTDTTTPIINTETHYEGPEGTATTGGKKITIRNITFPKVPEKADKTGDQNVKVRKGEVERDTKQIPEWQKLTTGDGNGLNKALDKKIKEAWHSGSETNPTYFMRIRNFEGQYLVGTRTKIRNRVVRPYWKKNGKKQFYDVDHIKEYQLGGHDTDNNLWLLNSEKNRSSGSKINSAINRELKTLLSKWSSSRKPTAKSARNAWNVTLQSINWTGPVAGNKEHYTVTNIADDADSMAPVRAMKEKEVTKAGLNPGEGEFVIFNNSTGGRAKTIKLHPSQGTEVPFTDKTFVKGFTPSKAVFHGENEKLIEIHGSLWSGNSAISGNGHPYILPIRRMENLPQAGYMNIFKAQKQIQEIFDSGVSANGMSPLRLSSVGFDELGSPQIEGTVETDISFLQGSNIGFYIRENNLGVEKTFSMDELNTPSPFEIREASLTLGLSTKRGLSAEGNVDFALGSIGEGSITASVGSSESFKMDGDFAFDENIFGKGSSAKVRMGYEEGNWSMGGTITIPKGKVPGIKTATIVVDYSEADGFSAQGDAELDIPGVESGSLSISHTEAEGFIIGGEFALSADTPGIKGGNIQAQVKENKDGSGYSVSARGEAQPDIPGLESNLIVSYDDGAFTAEVTAGYSRGMLSGSVKAGVTNRTVGEDGVLSDTAEKDSPLIVYGGGSLTLTLSPWLEGTAGVEFAPNGEITVSGEIGLPDELEIFSLQKIQKSILSISVQVPIIPGIVAEIGGGLGAIASIGPGVIDDLRLGITYNPDKEEETTVTGDAHLRIPANAGLRLFVRAGVGIGIWGASVTGGIEIGGALGISGAAEAGVHIEWSPDSGLDIQTDLAVYAQPSFEFDIAGYVSAKALGFSLYDETWKFASFSFGSDYRFGIKLPIHYHEGEPFDISLNDVEFEVPDINTSQLMRDLISRIS